MQSKLITYLENQRRDAQWGVFLKALVHELSSSLGSDQTHQLLLNAGMRVGQSMALPKCDSIEQMEAAANRIWSSLGWGVVSFTERRDWLEICHEGAPLDPPSPDAFAAFLEGVYQQWFVALGAGAQLQVRRHEIAGSDTFLYRLAA